MICLVLLMLVRSSLPINFPTYTRFPEDTGKRTFRLIVKSMGLNYHKYVVETEDGYILNLNRIMNPDLPKKTSKGFPVLMVNGLFMHSDSWVLHSKPEHNPAVAFLINGYDVWLGDQRGTMRSKKHKSATRTKKHRSFWDFSFHEIGMYDLPAFINFILNKTQSNKLIYMGNSLGTTVSYVLLSERPEYNDKMSLVLSTMPVGVQPLISTRPRSVQIFYKFLKTIMGYYESIGAGTIRDISTMRKYLKTSCLASPTMFLWQSGMTSGTGMHPDMEDNRFCYQSILQMGGASAKTILHALQLFETGEFAQYNYGEEENMKRYNQTSPPKYKLDQIKATVAAYYSNTDMYAPSETVTKMLDRFGGLTYRCEMRDTHHVDALFGTQFHKFIPDMIEVFNSAIGKGNQSKISSGHCPPYERTWTAFEDDCKN